MDYKWVEDIEEFRDISAKWDTALINSGNYNPFLLSDFIITWWKHFSDNLRLRILVIYNSDKIQGGIPLFMRKPGVKDCFARVLSFVGGPTANYTEPFYAAKEVNMLLLLEKALAKRNDWDVLHLSDVRATNRLIDECHNYVRNKHFKLYISQDHMNLAIDLSAGKENYLASLSKKLLRDLKAKRRHLSNKCGELKLIKISGREEVERYFGFYIKFSLNAFASRNRNSVFEDERYSAFLKEFFVLMDQKQRLYGHALIAGDEIMAVSFGYKFGKGFNWVLTSFNYDYKYFRPGYLLIEELINEICNRGEIYYNWYGHEAFYKTQLCNEKTPLFQIFLARLTWRGLQYSMLMRIKAIVRYNRILKSAVEK